MTRGRRLKTIGLALLAVIAAASFATAPATAVARPEPIFAGAQIDPAVLAIFQRSCQDCHSDRTSYPWYSYVAPVSFLIKSDVDGGREHLNLSRWSQYSLVRKERALSEIANQVEDRDMPLAQYLWIHRKARLSDAEVDAIFSWTQSERSRLIAEANRAAPR